MRGRLEGYEQWLDLPVELLLRAVGYRGQQLPGLPFDSVSGTIANRSGRVVDERGTVQPGEYVVGWIKRGAVGVIGTNKSDAVETVAALWDDLDSSAAATTEKDPVAELAAAGKPVADFATWLRIDAAEVARGEEQGRIRTKIATWTELAGLVADDAPRAAGSDAEQAGA